MPELPEVETTRRGISAHICGHTVTAAVVREHRLRWPVPRELNALLHGQRLGAVSRRAKYLLLHFPNGTLILHLGMSGSLRVLAVTTPPEKHDHLDLVFDDGRCLRLRDPRRFGAVLWTREDPARHPLLARLGPEPLSAAFDGARLHRCATGRKRAIKALLMDSQVVVGVGNIYANEALFMAGVHPARAAGRVSRARCDHLADAIKTVLSAAIRAGGTTLRDFTTTDGTPGHFRTALQVYGREAQACPQCAQPIRRIRLAQRSTFYCPHCQH